MRMRLVAPLAAVTLLFGACGTNSEPTQPTTTTTEQHVEPGPGEIVVHNDAPIPPCAPPCVPPTLPPVHPERTR